MRYGERGFTLIELMIVVVIVGILAAIGLANYSNMQNQARVGQVKSNMHIVQLAAEEFATRNNGVYPNNAAAVTAEGGMTLAALLPGGAMPDNPFTNAATTLDWTNAPFTAPATDPAGGVSLNVSQSMVGGVFDMYDILGADDTNAVLSLVLSNY
jgi:prepilin-type N-terminal cleavage/methylation domain-containing protein